MEPQYEDEIEVDLKELFTLLLSEWKAILLSAVLVAAIVGMFNQFILEPRYSSTSKLYILTKSTSLTSIADLQIGSSLTQDYMVIIKGRSVVEEVINNLKLDLDYEEMVGKVTVENPSDSRILNITIVDSSPEGAKQIADEFAKVSAAYISEKMDQDPPNIIENAYADRTPVGPHIKRNMAVGFFIGLICMCIVITVTCLVDDTLMDAEEIEKYLTLNMLAAIPENTCADEKKKSRKRKKEKKGKHHNE